MSTNHVTISGNACLQIVLAASFVVQKNKKCEACVYD